MATQVSTKAEAVRAPAPHRWTRRQYEQMVEAGILDENDRVELIEGEIVTTLTLDRTQKARLYARHGIPEYWILNVVDDCLEVYRDPTGETYQTKLTLHRGDTITPPQGAELIAVADMLP